MAADLDTLEKRYFKCCKRQGIPPNRAVLSALFKAKLKKACHEVCSFVILLDDLKDVDFHPTLDLLMDIDTSEIDAVDMINRSSCLLSGQHVLSLLRAIRKKLRIVDLQDISFGKDFLLDLAQHGLACQVLNLRFSHFRKLNMSGNFDQLHTLNLDFSTSLSSFREDCFVCMPNLKFLSLCETRVTNLWTTSAALAKLPNLTELRFQNCLHCDDKGHNPAFDNRLCCHDAERCPALSRRIATRGKSIFGMDFSHLHRSVHIGLSLFSSEDFLFQDSNMEEEDMDYDANSDSPSTLEDSSDNSEVDFSISRQDISQVEFLPDVPPDWNELVNLQNEISYSTSRMQEAEDFFSRSLDIRPPSKYVSYHASPICYEKYYREFMIVSLPKLESLDNLPIERIDKDTANDIFAQHFECLPYKRNNKESIVSILHKRETKISRTYKQIQKEKSFYPSGKSQYLYSRSLSAAKVGSSAWPSLHPLSITGSMSRDEGRSFRPRQFEYHPSDPSLMVFGTLDGEVVVINHECEKIIRYIPSLGAMHSVLGLCWLKKHASKLIAGSDNGSLRLFDIQQVPATTTGNFHSAGSVAFDEFDQLTSVHVNSTDELFLASGYSKHVALYDINSGRRLQVFADMHREHINVVKFSNHSPSIFCTSSFDQDVKMWDLRQKPSHPCYTALSSRGNVMVCFSPDDHYLLVSAVDNEVKQLLAVDGRLHLDFGIASTGSSQNYTRSYYMNGKDYVISGSCDENVVRICCAQTGRRLRDVSLEGKGSGASMFVQSLRGDPFRDFNVSVLAAYIRPSSNSEIVKVNLLASRNYDKECFNSRHCHPVSGMGG